MKTKIIWFALGFFLACLIPAALFAVFWHFEGDHRMIFREQTLASGKIIKVTSFNLAWGIDHKDRNTSVDGLALEYVSSDPNAGEQTLDQETLEVFEMIRPVSEQWGFQIAYVSAFPTTERKGKYYTYNFTREPIGPWKFERKLAKVFIND